MSVNGERYQKTRAQELGLAEGTGKRYNQADLEGLIDYSDKTWRSIEMFRSDFNRDLFQEYSPLFRNLNNLSAYTRIAKATELLERMMFQLAAENIPPPPDDQKRFEKPVSIIFPTGKSRFAVHYQSDLDFLKEHLGAQVISLAELVGLTYGQMLRKFRTDRGLTQSELARRINLSQSSYISNWETLPAFIPNRARTIIIAQALELTSEETEALLKLCPEEKTKNNLF